MFSIEWFGNFLLCYFLR